MAHKIWGAIQWIWRTLTDEQHARGIAIVVSVAGALGGTYAYFKPSSQAESLGQQQSKPQPQIQPELHARPPAQPAVQPASGSGDIPATTTQVTNGANSPNINGTNGPVTYSVSNSVPPTGSSTSSAISTIRHGK
jgi:hypothetical protein